MSDHTENIVLSLMAAGINRATAEQILAQHDDITGAAAFRVAAEVAVRAARSAGDDERGQYAAQVAARVGADLRRTADGIQEKATAVAAPATPDFFQPGHTYAEPGDTTDWRFRCDAITTHPEDGERTALGWRHFRGEWEPYAYGEDDFEIHQIADRIGVTEAGDRS